MQESPEITFRHLDRTPELEALIHEQLSRLETFSDALVSASVVVEQPNQHPDSGTGYRARVEVRFPPNHRVVGEQGPGQGHVYEDVETPVRRAFQAVERQLREITEKQREAKKDAQGEPGAGIVKTIDKEKRFGIIKTPAGRDVYFVASAVTGNDFDRIGVGDTVRYVDQPGYDDGPRASTVQLVETHGQPPPIEGNRSL